MSDQKIALVTGGGKGIGQACAEALHKAGCRVAVTYRSTTPENKDFYAVKCDIAKLEDVDNAFAEVESNLGPIDILVSNAGITKDGLTLKMSEDDFQRVADTNLTGSWRVAKRAIRSMVKNRYGRIVFVSSVVGLGGSAGQANYSASKAGLVGLARSLAKELASRSITVNVVAPGPVETEMITSLSQDRQDAIKSFVPLNRFASPQEVASLIEFLTVGNSEYITGAVIPIDGGMSMGA